MRLIPWSLAAVPLLLAVWLIDAALLFLLLYGLVNRLAGRCFDPRNAPLRVWLAVVPEAIWRWLDEKSGTSPQRWLRLVTGLVMLRLVITLGLSGLI